MNTMTNRGGIFVAPHIIDISQRICPQQKENILKYEWMPDNGSLMIFAPSINRLLIHGGQMNYQNALELQYKYMSDYVVNPFLFSLEFEKRDAGKSIKKEGLPKKKSGATKQSTVHRSSLFNLTTTVNSSPSPSYNVTWDIQPTSLATEEPPPRYHHAGCIWKKYNLLVHGGQTEDMKNLNDLWCLNLLDWQWRKITSSGPEIPSARRMHSMEIVDDQYLFLFGGLPLNSELYRLDMDTLHWVNIDFSLAPSRGLSDGEGMHPRGNQSDQSSVMNGTREAAEIIATDALPHTTSKFSLHASPRFGHSINLVGNSLVLFGGQDMANYFTETIQIPLRNVDEFLRNIEAYQMEKEAREGAKERLLQINRNNTRDSGHDEWTPNSEDDQESKRGTPGSPAGFTGFHDEADFSSMLVTTNDDGMDEIASYQKRKQLEDNDTGSQDSDDSTNDKEIESLIFNDKVSKRFTQLKNSLKAKNKKIEEQKKLLKAKDDKIEQQQEEMQRLREQVQGLQISNRGLERYILSKGEEIPPDLLQFLPGGGPLTAHSKRNEGNGDGFGGMGDYGRNLGDVPTLGGATQQRANGGIMQTNQPGRLGIPNTSETTHNNLMGRSLDKQDIDAVIQRSLGESNRKDGMDTAATARLTENQIISMDNDQLTKTVRTKEFMIQHMREHMKHQEADLIINDRMMQSMRQNNEKLKQRVNHMEERMRTYREEIRKEFEDKVDDMLKEKRDNMERCVMESEFKLKTLEGRHEALLDQVIKLQEENAALVQAQESSKQNAVKQCPNCGFWLEKDGGHEHSGGKAQATKESGGESEA